MDKSLLEQPVFSQILNAINDGVVVEDSRNRIVFVNDCYCRMLGIAKEEAIGKASIDYIYEADRPLFIDKSKRRDAIKSDSYPIRLTHKIGRVIDVLASVQSLRDEAGDFSGNLAVLTDITLLKEHQRQLEESNDRFKTLCDVTSEGVMVHSDEIIVDGNDQFFKMLGYKREELVGQSVTRLMTAESIKLFQQYSKEQYEGDFEVEGVKKDGTVLSGYANSRFTTYLGQQARIVSILDLTTLKTHQHEKELLLSLLDHISDSVVVVDYHTLKVLDANKPAYEPRHLSKEELLSKSISELTSVTPAQLVELKEQLPVIKYKQIEYEHVMADGTTYPVEATLTYYELKGKPYVIAVSRNITERKKYEKEIHENEQKYRTLVEMSDQCIVMLKTDGTILFINSEGEKQVGLRHEEMIGKKIYDFYPQQSKIIQHGLADVVQSKESFQETIRVTTVYGERWKLITRIPLLNDEQEVYAIQIIVKDIDDIKRLEEENRHYYNQIEKTERLAGLGTMMGMMSHEINQPLTVLKLLLQDMQEGSLEPEEFQEHIKDCLYGVNHAIGILRRYRELTRFKGFEGSTILICKVLEKLVAVFSSVCKKNNAHINLHDSVYQLSPLKIQCDFEQVAFILLSNAIDASNDAQACEIDLTAEKVENGLIFTVSDQGPGISSEVQERIFEPFFSTKPREEGTGLGLPIVKRILDNCGGRITCQSISGQGTTFKVFIPVSP